MACVQSNRMRIIAPNPQFVDQRTLNLPPPPPRPPPPPPPFPPPPPPFFVVRHPDHWYPRPLLVPAGFSIQFDQQRTQMLIQFMMSEGLEPEEEEEMRRKDAIDQLKQIVSAWIKKVAGLHRLPEELVSSTSATILTYGSYGLGVHGSNSDIDALCVGPHFATLEKDFFIFLRDMLQHRPEVSDVHCIKTAKVPLMRFKFNGISVDFPFAKLYVDSVHEGVDIFDPYLGIPDGTSFRSLSGVRANRHILESVPNLKNFKAVLRCIKLWARRRGIYSHLLGFYGGIHLAILAALVCQSNPSASISALICIFFKCFSHWHWPEPVILQGIPPLSHPDGRNRMPIRMPCSPFDWCNSNITRSTFSKIKTEFWRGCLLIRDIWRPDYDWSCLFEPFPYTMIYTTFVQILLTAPDNDELVDWVGWVKSRFLSLLLKLEMVQGYCDPNPTEYVNEDIPNPNTIFYWGLIPNRSNPIDINSVKEDFMKSVNKDFYSNTESSCELELSIVEASQLSKNGQLKDLGGERESSEECCVMWMRRSICSCYNQQIRRRNYSRHPPHYVMNSQASDREN